jgi:hypothetical protein
VVDLPTGLLLNRLAISLGKPADGPISDAIEAIFILGSLQRSRLYVSNKLPIEQLPLLALAVTLSLVDAAMQCILLPYYVWGSTCVLGRDQLI